MWLLSAPIESDGHSPTLPALSTDEIVSFDPAQLLSLQRHLQVLVGDGVVGNDRFAVSPAPSVAPEDDSG